MESFSYPPDSTSIRKEVQHYYWKKKEFMPDKDFDVSFIAPAD
jgi:hypothetical protein